MIKTKQAADFDVYSKSNIDNDDNIAWWQNFGHVVANIKDSSIIDLELNNMDKIALKSTKTLIEDGTDIRECPGLLFSCCVDDWSSHADGNNSYGGHDQLNELIKFLVALRKG